MYNISLKYKRPLFLIFKLIIVVAAFYFIYQKLAGNQLLSFAKLKEQFSLAFSNNILVFIGILLFTDANWFLEIFKWQTLVSTFKKLTFLDAFEQCFGSHTVSLITPNRIGEYGAKALFFEKKYQKKVIALNFIGNMSQLLATVFFGVIGLTFILSNFTLQLPTLNFQNTMIVIAILFLIYIAEKQFEILQIEKYLKNFSRFLKVIPNSVYIKILVLSYARYLVFSHQFYFLLWLFGVETDYFTLMSLIFCMYFFASFIPTISIFDWVIKGSVAVWLFQLIGLNELTIITVTTFMWLLNFAIPALFGNIFVLNFKTTHLE